MEPTQNPATGDDLVTIARTLRDAALYLRRYGWIQGAYYDQTATVFTPAACVVGAIGMVCYGGPVDAPAQHFDEPGFDEFEMAVAYLDLEVDRRYQDVYAWNDDRTRNADDVIGTLLEIAARYEVESTFQWLAPGSPFLTWLTAVPVPARGAE